MKEELSDFSQTDVVSGPLINGNIHIQNEVWLYRKWPMKGRFDLFKNKGFLGERLFELGVYLKTEKIKTIISVSQVHFSQKPQSFFQNSLQI